MEKKKLKLVHGSLFSGFGGFDLAASWMGWENAFHCEINEFCSTILNYWFPDAKHYSDITTTDFTPWRGRVDIITGGFPCQPFSVAGQRKGADDNRYLWPQMLRVIREVQPTWVVGENVGGILTMVQPGKEVEVAGGSSLFGEDYHDAILTQQYVVETICEDLEREGYSVQPILIPACSVGAPHRRDRVWFVAHSDCKRDSSCRKSKSSERNGSGNDVDPKERKQPSEWIDGLHGFLRDVADTDGERCDDRFYNRRERYVHSNQERNSEENQSKRNEREYRFGKNGETSAYSTSEQGERMQFGESEHSFQKQRKFGRSDCENNSSDTNSQLFPGRMFKGKKERNQSRIGIESLHGFSGWEKFPTQSPICSGDDGLSTILDRDAVLKGRKSTARTDTFNAWREESVKGYGNAVVPQVPFEIFQAIEATYNQP